jgi:hypothetical protein
LIKILKGGVGMGKERKTDHPLAIMILINVPKINDNEPL